MKDIYLRRFYQKMLKNEELRALLSDISWTHFRPACARRRGFYQLANEQPSWEWFVPGKFVTLISDQPITKLLRCSRLSVLSDHRYIEVLGEDS